MKFMAEIYSVTVQFPRHESFRLSEKLRRRASSIPHDVIRREKNCTDREFEDRLMYARNTLLEVQTQLMIANELQYIGNEETQRLRASAEELSRRIGSLAKSLHSKIA